MNSEDKDLNEAMRREVFERLEPPAMQSSTLAQNADSLASLLSLVGAELFALPQVDGYAINLIQESAQALVTAHLKLPEQFSGIQNTYQGFRYRLDESDVNVKVFKSGSSEMVSAENLEQYAETTRVRFERWQMRSMLVVPVSLHLKDGSRQVIGAVMVFSCSQLLDVQLESRISEIADNHAALIQIHWNYQQLVERSETAEVMHTKIQQFIAYITRMSSITNLDELYAAIGKEFLYRFRFDMVNILLAGDGELAMTYSVFSKPYQHVAQRWEPFSKSTRFSLTARDGQSALLFISNQRFLVDDVEKILHLPMAEKDRQSLAILKTVRTFIIVPIRLNDAAIGVMWLATLGEPIFPSESDLTLIDMLSSFIGTAIRNAQAHMLVEQQSRKIELLNEDLQQKMVLLDQLARMDRLTGLNNFGNFEEELKRRASEYARAGANGALSIILMDIDHFKAFNDLNGHPAGNQVLQEVATRIQKCVRDMDFVARYGGEEFVVLLPQCDLAGAGMIAERIRSHIAGTPFIVNGEEHPVAISGGCAQFLPSESTHDFICRADVTLYDAKRKGRNRIELAQPVAAASK
ncbi:hypothetical protein BH11PSE11_BH11PSE11_23420 [soil metagenome]